MKNGSKKFTLNSSDLVNLAKNAALVGLAAVLTFVGENIADVDLGPNGIMIVPIISVAIDTFVRWIKDNTKKENNE